MVGNNSITVKMFDYYDYGNMSMEDQFLLLTMSYTEYKIGKILSNHNQDKVFTSDN